MHDTAMQRVVQHLLVDFIDTAGNGLDQSTATNDGVELQRNVRLPQFVKHQLAPEVLLLGNGIEGCQFLGSMSDVTQQ